MSKQKARTADDRALDPKAQESRYGRAWQTLLRWRDNPEVAYPQADFYVGKTPMTWLSTLQAWEASRPRDGAGEPEMLRKGRARISLADDHAEAS